MKKIFNYLLVIVLMFVLTPKAYAVEITTDSSKQGTTDTNSYLVPFVITGKYKLFGGVRIEFLKPYKVGDNLTEENNKLKKKKKKKGYLNYEQRDYSNIDWDSFYDNLRK